MKIRSFFAKLEDENKDVKVDLVRSFGGACFVQYKGLENERSASVDALGSDDQRYDVFTLHPPSREGLCLLSCNTDRPCLNIGQAEAY